MAMIGSISLLNSLVIVRPVEREYQKVSSHYGQDQVNQ